MFRIGLFFFFLLALFSVSQGEQVMTITTPAFENNQDIPAQYTCAGADINPPLTIKDIPLKTQSLALYIHDPDASVGEWSHWVVYNIKPETQNIAENSIPGTELFNDFGKYHYGGPCPPTGKPHHYWFEVYALDRKLEIIEGGTIKDLQQAMKGHILAKSTLVGMYTKHSR